MVALFGHNPFSSATRRVCAIRVRLYHYEATDLARLWSSGRYWTAKDGGAQAIGGIWTRQKVQRALTMSYGKAQLADGFRPMHEPSMWHPDHFLWQRRSVMYQRLSELYDAGADLGDTICAFDDEGRFKGVGHGIDSLWWRRFWNEFLPEVRPLHQRAVATTACVEELSKAKSVGSCPCDCVSCELWSGWRGQRA